jgi:catechol 2,3-dioxygenase-like lactoylglutathione lyase family enzyme
MKRVTGIGGIFFKTKDPKKTREWYKNHLGFNTDDQYGTSFEWRKTNKPEEKGFSAWSTFSENTTYFEPSPKEFMINFRVENLVELLKVLKEEGITVLDEIEECEYGKFAHILDWEGNKIELWEANDEEYEKILDGKTTF